MYAKYAMGLPLYRQEQDFKHLGANIGRGTMANWIITCSKKYLEPVYKHLHKQLLKRPHLMADETPLQMLKEPERRAQSKSYIWVVRTGEADKKPIILFNYTETRKGTNAADFLNGTPEGFYLMTDGYKQQDWYSPILLILTNFSISFDHFTRILDHQNIFSTHRF